MAKNKFTSPNEEEFLQLIKTNSPENPSISSIQRTVIKSGPQTYKLASIMHILNPNTGEICHEQLHLNAFPFRVNKGIDFSEKERLTRWSCEDNEIEQLRIFLNNYQHADSPGEHVVVRNRPDPSFEKLLETVESEEFDTNQFLGLISALADRAKDLRQLPELGETDNIRMVAAALRVAHRSNVIGTLSGLIENEAVEQEFQVLLEQNWWMLGGQYVSLIPRREWTVEDSLDILLQTADRYFEIIELKRSNAKVFVKDHDNWIVSADVNRAVNQAAHYISEIEANRGNLLRKYKVDLYKLKAKVLIGYLEDDSLEYEAKREALRMYNSHLNGIEVITYDELARIADNVVHANLGESGHNDRIDDINLKTENDVPF